MTTNMNVNYIDNITIKNNTLFIDLNKSMPLSAIVWSRAVHESTSKHILEYLSTMINHIYINNPHCEFWLIASNETIQPDNRITRHNKLWLSLKKRSITIPSKKTIDEFPICQNGGLRYFSGLKFNHEDTGLIYDIMQNTQSSIIVINEYLPLAKMTEFLQSGWGLSNSTPPFEILRFIKMLNYVAINYYGSFDDPEIAVAAIGTKSALNHINII